MMSGFGFIEYKDPQDARDVVPGNDFALLSWPHPFTNILSIQLSVGFRSQAPASFAASISIVTNHHQDGTTLLGERLTVQFARGSRHREGGFGTNERSAPRPRRTAHRMQISGLPGETSWQVCAPSRCYFPK